MLKIMEGEHQVTVYLHHLDGYLRCDEMLAWLVRNRLTGKEFLNWAKFHFGASILDMPRYILKRLEKTEGPRPIFLGKDLV